MKKPLLVILWIFDILAGFSVISFSVWATSLIDKLWSFIPWVTFTALLVFLSINFWKSDSKSQPLATVKQKPKYDLLKSAMLIIAALILIRFLIAMAIVVFNSLKK